MIYLRLIRYKVMAFMKKREFYIATGCAYKLERCKKLFVHTVTVLRQHCTSFEREKLWYISMKNSNFWFYTECFKSDT